MPPWLERVRKSTWCQPRVAVAAFVLVALILKFADTPTALQLPAILGWIAFPLAIVLFCVGTAITVLRLLILQYSEDRHLGPLEPRPTSPNCPKCGYNLTGNESGVCPECGLKLRRLGP